VHSRWIRRNGAQDDLAQDPARVVPQVEASPDLFAKAHEYTRPEEVRAMGLYPYFYPVESSHGTEVVMEGRRRIMIGSNNYLGLTHDPRLVEAAEQATRKYGTACTGSRFLNGNTDLHERLEDELAALVGKEAALVFPTGFQTNLGVIATLVGPGDAVFIDKLDHASIVDGAVQSGGHIERFRHGDLRHLEAKLAYRAGMAKMVIVDGVFSMEGDLADVPGLVELCREHGARLVVDDAHGVGVFGAQGGGVAQHFGLEDEVDLIVGTFSKSLASIGGFVAGDAQVVSYLRHNARNVIFSAAIPASACAAALKAVEIIRTEPERREKLWENARRMKSELTAMGFNTLTSESPIVPVVVGSMIQTFKFWRALFDAGIFTNPVIAPAVPENSCRIRTSYMATHTSEQLDEVLEAFQRCGREAGLI
jgi:8-amino-7-oxononanoate synthase